MIYVFYINTSNRLPHVKILDYAPDTRGVSLCQWRGNNVLEVVGSLRDFEDDWEANWGQACLVYLYSSLDTLNRGTLRHLVGP